jgi:hypothetical protein
LFITVNSTRTTFMNMLDIGMQCGQGVTLPGFDPLGPGEKFGYCRCHSLCHSYDSQGSQWENAIKALKDNKEHIQTQIAGISSPDLSNKRFWNTARNLVDLYSQAALEAGNVFTSVVEWSKSKAVSADLDYWVNTCHREASQSNPQCGWEKACYPTEALMRMRRDLQHVSESLLDLAKAIEQGQAGRIPTTDRVFNGKATVDNKWFKSNGGIGYYLAKSDTRQWDEAGDIKWVPYSSGPARLHQCYGPSWRQGGSHADCKVSVQSFPDYVYQKYNGGNSGQIPCVDPSVTDWPQAYETPPPAYTCVFPGVVDRSKICNMVYPAGYVRKPSAYFWTTRNLHNGVYDVIRGKLIGENWKMVADKFGSYAREENSCVHQQHSGGRAEHIALYHACQEAGYDRAIREFLRQKKTLGVMDTAYDRCAIPEVPRGARFKATSCDFSAAKHPWKHQWTTVDKMDVADHVSLNNIEEVGSYIENCKYQIQYDPLYRQIYSSLPAAAVVLNGYIAALTNKDKQLSESVAQAAWTMKYVSGVEEWRP